MLFETLNMYHLREKSCSDHHLLFDIEAVNYSDKTVGAVTLFLYLVSIRQEGMGMDHHLLVCLVVKS